MNCDGDIITQCIRHRTSLFGDLGGLLKCGLVDPRNVATYLEIHGLNLRATGAKLQGTYRVYLQTLDRGSALRETMSEAHCVALGVGGCNQLFRAGFTIGSLGS